MTRYLIEIANTTAQESPVKAVTGSSDTVGGETSAGASWGEKYAKSMAKRLVSYAAISSTVNQIANHAHSTINLRTGANEVSQRVNFVYQKSFGLVNSAILGGIAGAPGGPLGIAVGAGVGALLNLGGQAIDYLKKNDIIQKEQELEDISRRMQMMRATASGRRYSNITEF